MDSLRDQWAAGRTTLGVWVSIPSLVSAEAAARAGYDYVCVDTQHGVIDYSQAAAIVPAVIAGQGTPPIARVPWNEPGVIGKMLDAGMQGVIVPMVNTRAEAEAVVRSMRYAPAGSRSFGPIMSAMRDGDHFNRSAEQVAVIPMIETAEAVRNLDEILAVPGIDAVYVGPADLSVSLGLPPKANDDREEFTDALTTIVAGCRKHGVVPGMHATAQLIERRLEQGFQMLTVTSDLLAMRGLLATDLDLARRAGTGAGAASGVAAGPDSVY